MTGRLARMAASIALLSVVGLTSCATFEQQVAKKVKEYDALMRGQEIDVALSGGLGEANTRLISTVPDSQKTPADYFVLGNMLYSLDWDTSFAYHKKAYDANPNRPETIYEMALEHHRRRDFKAALPLYESLADLEGISPAVSALKAQCYIHEGSYSKAIESWKAANFSDNHSEIDIAIHEVFGKRSPLARQSDLVHEVGKRKGAMSEILLLGLEWDTSWWNAEVNWEALEADARVIEAAYGANSGEALETRLLLDVMRSKESGPDALSDTLEKAQYILNDRLPASSFIARRIIAAVHQSNITTAADIEKRFRPQLLERIKARDKEAMDVLAYLHAVNGSKEELANLDLQGWKEYKDPNYALSYLFGLRDDEPALKRALPAAVTDFPDDSRILYLSYVIGKKEGKPDLALLARVIETEYYGLKNDRSRFGYALNALYLELADLVKQTRR